MKDKIKIGIYTTLTTIALGFNNYALYKGNIEDLLKLGILGSTLLWLFFYSFYSRKNFLKSKMIYSLSALFTFFMIFGNSYLHLGNGLLVFKNIGFFLLAFVMAVGYFILFWTLLSIVFSFLNEKGKNSRKVPKFFQKMEEHPYLFSLLFILLCWLPYILAFYPIILSPDPSFQIKQFFGIRTKYADYSVLLDENVVLTNHHPVVHTLLLGGCLKIGHSLGWDNLGLFLYSILQITILSSVLAFSLWYMKKIKVSPFYRIMTLLIYSLVPMFPLYAMSAVKDVLFGAFTFLYIILIHYIITHKEKKYSFYQCALMVCLFLLVILFRNNGLHMILLSFPFVLLVAHKNFKPLLAVFLITLFLSTCYTKVLLPAFHITPGSIREVLSIPFQQTARYVKYHSEDLTYSEINRIDKVLGYKDLAQRYNPELADPVKNNFNKYTTSTDLKEYFLVWFHCFWRHPVTYVDATINNVYGFFYPEKQNWYVYRNYDKRILEDGFDYHYNSLSLLRKGLSGFAVSYPKLPVLGLLSNIGFSCWVIFTLVGYVLYRKWYDFLPVYLPALVLILVCIAGPANTYFRYALPFVFSLPFMVGVLLAKRGKAD